MRTKHYTYRIRWSQEDQEHFGTVEEFPSLSWLDADPSAAFDGIRNLVAEVLENMAQTGEEPPLALINVHETTVQNIRTLPIEQTIAGITTVAQTARQADAELTLALAYAHRVMEPRLSLRKLSGACGLAPSTIRARVQAAGVLEQVQVSERHRKRRP